jgi:xylulokinase
MRFHKQRLEVYHATSHITLVSAFLASVFLGKIAPVDINNVCGINLWDVKAGAWSEPLLQLAAGEDGLESLKQKLGTVREDGGGSMGPIAKYFVQRYGFSSDCAITPFRGDNPSTILALPSARSTPWSPSAPQPPSSCPPRNTSPIPPTTSSTTPPPPDST